MSPVRVLGWWVVVIALAIVAISLDPVFKVKIARADMALSLAEDALRREDRKPLTRFTPLIDRFLASNPGSSVSRVVPGKAYVINLPMGGQRIIFDDGGE